MKKLCLLLILASVLVFTGCPSTETIESRKVASTEIYQYYSISASKNRTNVSATFRVGGATGTTVDLDAPAKILHNGKPMNERKPDFMKGTDYGDSAEEFVPTHKFAYTDAKGKTWQNDIAVQALEINSTEIIISKRKGGKITFSRPVGKDETVEISINSDQNPPDESKTKSRKKVPQKVYSTQLQVAFNPARSIAAISPISLKNFAEGTASISLTVKKSKQISQSAKGGQIDFTYNADSISANVVK